MKASPRFWESKSGAFKPTVNYIIIWIIILILGAMLLLFLRVFASLDISEQNKDIGALSDALVRCEYLEAGRDTCYIVSVEGGQQFRITLPMTEQQIISLQSAAAKKEIVRIRFEKRSINPRTGLQGTVSIRSENKEYLPEQLYQKENRKVWVALILCYLLMASAALWENYRINLRPIPESHRLGILLLPRRYWKPDISVTFCFNGTKESRVKNGYHPNHRIGDRLYDTGVHYYEGGTDASDGTVKGTISFYHPDDYPHSLAVGMKLRIQEDDRIIGYAKIDRILNKKLQQGQTNY